MKLLFWIVRNKANKHGKAPIYCRITINGARAELSTDIYVLDKEFDQKKRRIKGNGDQEKTQNNYIDQLSHTLHNIHTNEIFYNKNTPTSTDIKNLYTQRNKQFDCHSIMLEYANNYFTTINNSRILNVHLRYIKIINRAIANLDCANLPINKCDNYLIDRIARHIIEVLNYGVPYTKKVVQFLKATLLYAYNRKYINFYPAGYKVPYTNKTELIYLEEAEIEQIENYAFKEPLNQSADLFITQCYTGLAYADLSKLELKHISTDINKTQWINLSRQKIETAHCTIPLTHKVKEILEKYDYKLPILSNIIYNKHLKDIGDLVGISKKITSHVGRKTYGTLLLNKNVPIETVSRLLGHSNINMTQQSYAKVLHMKVAKDIKNVI